jgi:hypothetical protein
LTNWRQEPVDTGRTYNREVTRFAIDEIRSKKTARRKCNEYWTNVEATTVPTFLESGEYCLGGAKFSALIMHDGVTSGLRIHMLGISMPLIGVGPSKMTASPLAEALPSTQWDNLGLDIELVDGDTLLTFRGERWPMHRANGTSVKQDLEEGIYYSDLLQVSYRIQRDENGLLLIAGSGLTSAQRFGLNATRCNTSVTKGRHIELMADQEQDQVFITTLDFGTIPFRRLS